MNGTIRTGLMIAAALLAVPAAALEVGEKAPDFVAPSTAGEIELSQVVKQGPVVLALYMADFTSG